jgi:hypothetical protein
MGLGSSGVEPSGFNAIVFVSFNKEYKFRYSKTP